MKTFDQFPTDETILVHPPLTGHHLSFQEYAKHWWLPGALPELVSISLWDTLFTITYDYASNNTINQFSCGAVHIEGGIRLRIDPGPIHG